MRNKGRYAAFLLCLFFLNVIPAYAYDEAKEKASVENFLKKVIKAYHEQSETKLAKYYSLEDIEGSTVAFERALFRAIRAKEVRIDGIECLQKEDGYLYVGVSLLFVLRDGGEMPFYEYFLLLEDGAGGYTAVSEENYPYRIGKKIIKKKKEWEQTELYNKYQNAADAYMASYPGYTDVVYERLILLLNTSPKEMKESLNMTGTIFIMGITQLMMLSIWIVQKDKYYD